jgi:LPXTG-site transpeptidase (sortase) family protein
MAESSKIYPPATESVADLLGFGTGTQLNAGLKEVPSHFPGQLPVIDAVAVESNQPFDVNTEEIEIPETLPEPNKTVVEIDSALEADVAKATKPRIPPFVRMVGPYVLVFAIGIFLYYYYFNDFSLNNFLKNRVSISSNTKKASAMEELIKAQSKNYNSWISQFYFDVSDDSIIDPEVDNSKNGLSNFQKYLLNLNPKEYSTSGSGTADGQLVVEGIDPVTLQPFVGNRKDLVDNYFDLEVISNRIALGSISTSPDFNQTSNSTDFRGSQGFSSESGSVAGITTDQSPSQTTQTQPSTNGQTRSTAPVTGVTSTDINLNSFGSLHIPSLNVTVPVVWTKNVASFDKDLSQGVAHYPGTSLPGQVGTAYISGHSSGYAWSNNKYKTVFSKLGNLADGASFSVTVTLKNGKQVRYNYVVTRRGEYKANDQAQFASTADSVVALSTCWPLNTTARRLVVFGKLSQTENLN